MGTCIAALSTMDKCVAIEAEFAVVHARYRRRNVSLSSTALTQAMAVFSPWRSNIGHGPYHRVG